MDRRIINDLGGYDCKHQKFRYINFCIINDFSTVYTWIQWNALNGLQDNSHCLNHYLIVNVGKAYLSINGCFLYISQHVHRSFIDFFLKIHKSNKY